MVKVNEKVYTITGMIDGVDSVNQLDFNTTSNFFSKDLVKEENDEFTLTNNIGYECFVSKIDQNIKIHIVGFDDLFRSPVEINLYFKNCKETLNYLREVKFDNSLNYDLSLFVKQITKELYAKKWINYDDISIN